MCQIQHSGSCVQLKLLALILSLVPAGDASLANDDAAGSPVDAVVIQVDETWILHLPTGVTRYRRSSGRSGRGAVFIIHELCVSALVIGVDNW